MEIILATVFLIAKFIFSPDDYFWKPSLLSTLFSPFFSRTYSIIYTQTHCLTYFRSLTSIYIYTCGVIDAPPKVYGHNTYVISMHTWIPGNFQSSTVLYKVWQKKIFFFLFANLLPVFNVPNGFYMEMNRKTIRKLVLNLWILNLSHKILV